MSHDFFLAIGLFQVVRFPVSLPNIYNSIVRNFVIFLAWYLFSMNVWLENIVKSVQDIVKFMFMFPSQFLLENIIEYEKNFTTHNLSPQLLGIIEITYL